MNLGRKLLIIGGVLVGFWFSALMQSIFQPGMSLFSKIDTDSGTIIEYSGIVPHMELIPLIGFALLIAGATYRFWGKRKIKNHLDK